MIFRTPKNFLCKRPNDSHQLSRQFLPIRKVRIEFCINPNFWLGVQYSQCVPKTWNISTMF